MPELSPSRARGRARWPRAAVPLAALIAAGLALAADALLIEPRRLQRIERCTPFRGLPPALAGLRILHLSDFHYVPRDRWLPRQLARLAEETTNDLPDLIAITGDFVEWHEDAPAIAAMVGRLRSRYGVFAVLGNHDYGNACDPHERPDHPAVEQLSDKIGAPLLLLRDRPGRSYGNNIDMIVQALADQGVRVLRNTAVPLAIAGARLWVGGVDEPHQRRADLAAVCAAVPEDGPLLLLAHSPEVLEQPIPCGIGLILAGHTHGGQVCFPKMQPLVTHTRLHLPAYRGLIETDAGPMYISGGMGASVPLRFRCPPEITLHRLQPVACACGEGCGGGRQGEAPAER